MDRRIQKVAFLLRVIITISFFSLQTAFVFAQAPNLEDQIRIQVWYDVDPFPESYNDIEDSLFRPETAEGNVSDYNSGLFDYSIAGIKEQTPFFIGGMIYGWTFDYVPYDRTRKVDEFFEANEIEVLDQKKNPISYHDASVKDGKLYVWAYCNRTADQKLLYRRWNSIVIPKVHGTGSGSVEDGVEGIKTAVYGAIKNAVREYWRIYEKNKPKEIEGKILLTGEPRVYINEGQYVVDLDFFMETDRIIRYSIY